MATTHVFTRASVFLAIILAGLPLDSALAQATRPKLQGAPASGVLKPSKQVDPGMARAVPRVPAQSMPVIHPRPTLKDGTVVVPR